MRQPAIDAGVLVGYLLAGISEVTVKKCPSCAEEVQDDASFCKRCGSNLPMAEPTGPPIQPETSGKAIASLVLGLFFILLPASILAVVFGHLSYSEINRSAGRLKGKGMAIAGLILGYSGVALIPLVIILSMVVVMAPMPSGDTSRPEGNVLASMGRNTITSADLDQTIRDRFKNSPWASTGAWCRWLRLPFLTRWCSN